MDSALQGVIVGSLLSLGGQLLLYCLSSAKEKRDWERKQSADEDAWRRTMKRDEGISLRDAYQNAISALSTVIYDQARSGQATVDLVQEANKWIAHIYLRHPFSQLEEKFKVFSVRPRENASELRRYLVELAKAEEDLYISEQLNINEPDLPRREFGARTMTFLIDTNFRREQFIAGRELSVESTLIFTPCEMTREQRKLLIESLPPVNYFMPASFYLPMPEKREDGAINRSGNCWSVQFDPASETKHSLLKAWEQDYLAALAKLQEITDDPSLDQEVHDP